MIDIKDIREVFETCQEAEKRNRKAALDDIKFARLGEQWEASDREKRENERRPCLTINRLPSFIRQVSNDIRQNTPSIKCFPADSNADPETAEIINGLIRNIQYVSDADRAYDIGVDNSIGNGFGYFRIDIDYSYDDSFDQDIFIREIPNPFSIYGDPYSTKSDSSDWNDAFVLQSITKKAFKEKYGDKQQASWDDDYAQLEAPWMSDDGMSIAEYWHRELVEKLILLLSDGTVVEDAIYQKNIETFEAAGLQPVKDRLTKGYKTEQRIITGAEILEINPWAGRFIPIIPVYGEQVNCEGERHLRSLIRDAKDSQRIFNYWRTASTELVALAPKAPYIGPVGAFTTDQQKWSTANTKTHAYIEFDGQMPPQRQEFAGPPLGAIQEALNAADDMKNMIGIYDAGLGARSNETSGKAILARQKESDTSTFHFSDNLNRAIAHAGRVIIDLIPSVYSGPRVIRILGGDDKKQPQNVKINEEFMDEQKNMPKIYDLTLGKYDLIVEAGPSFNTRREEAANQMIELIRAFPQAAQVVGDLLVKNLDWPGAEEIAKRLSGLVPGNPEVSQLKQTIEQGKQYIQYLQSQLQNLANDKQSAMIKAQNDVRKLDIDAYNAETNRLKTTTPEMSPEQLQAIITQIIMQALNSPDILPGQMGN